MSDKSFNKYPLCNEITKALNLLNYKELTPVQELVIPRVLERIDVRVKAATGSGKTAAFGIPICENVDWLKNKPQALILVPTRELALQVAEEIRNIGRFKRIKVSAIFGKVSIDRQELELKQKTHIVVGTPGRTRDLLLRGSLLLDEIQFLVIDEADEMFYIGLKEQVEDIIKQLPTSRTTMLFSATLSEEINTLTNEFMHNPINIEIDTETKTADQITQLAYLVKEKQKLDALKYITMTQNPDSCIIFANTQTMVDEICTDLKQEGYPVRSLHGGMLQKERMQIMEEFKRGSFRYLVATDVVARGIDIDKLSLVINYDMSRGLANYVHRIGRTGRQTATGTSITLYTEKEEQKIEQLEAFTGTAIEKRMLTDYSVSDSQYQDFKAKINAFTPLKPEKGEKVNQSILKIHINAGKKAKIRTNEIVATICSIDGVKDTDIGIIQITELASFVEILNNKGMLVLNELRNKTIKGKVRKINIARR